MRIRDNGATLTGPTWEGGSRPTRPGCSYLVLGFDVGADGVFYWIADPDAPDGSEIPIPVPGEIAEIVDGRVSTFWRVSSGEGGLTVGPAAMANEYFPQFVVEQRGSAPDDFRRMLRLLTAEEHERASSTEDPDPPAAEP